MKQWALALYVGGIMFTIGSIFFLFADFQEWWFYRIGCFLDRRHTDAFEAANADVFQHSLSTLFGRIERAETGINFSISVYGSVLYLAGSILFIPAFEKYILFGEWLFIVGSAAIFFSQIWKIYRSAYKNIDDSNNYELKCRHIFRDIPVLLGDSCAGLGGLFYFLGTICFLPYFNINDVDQNRASILFVCGGTSFTLAGFIVQYRYYYNNFSDYNKVSTSIII
ncbi:hypothetical protein I4U23_022865 [Adineta vaga]|nr:hypothetical protein I4U23_022865 [Adineta vaga]